MTILVMPSILFIVHPNNIFKTVYKRLWQQDDYMNFVLLKLNLRDEKKVTAFDVKKT